MLVRSSAVEVKETEVLEDAVNVRTNIVRIDEESIDEKEGFSGWEYDEVQYNKNEYIAMLKDELVLTSNRIESSENIINMLLEIL